MATADATFGAPPIAGRRRLPFGWDVLVMAALSVAIYALAVRVRLPGRAVEERVGDLTAEAHQIEAALPRT